MLAHTPIQARRKALISLRQSTRGPVRRASSPSWIHELLWYAAPNRAHESTRLLVFNNIIGSLQSFSRAEQQVGSRPSRIVDVVEGKIWDRNDVEAEPYFTSGPRL